MEGSNPVSQVALAGAGAVPHDLSIITLFLQADLVVKIVCVLSCSRRSGRGR